MAQQIELQRSQSGYDNDSVQQLQRELKHEDRNSQRLQRMTSEEGAQQLQRELNEENLNLQRMTSEEERADRQRMRLIFNSVRIFFKFIFFQKIKVLEKNIENKMFIQF